MTLMVILCLLAAAGMFVLLGWLQKRHVSFTVRVLAALGSGILLGLILQLADGPSGQTTARVLAWLDVAGQGFVQLLRMIVIPLILVSIVTAIVKMADARSLGKIALITIGVLILTTAIAALIGAGMALAFGLTSEGLTGGSRETARGEMLQKRLGTLEELSIPKMLVDFLPANPFQDLTGARDTSIIAVVIFAVFLGLAALGVRRKQPVEGETLEKIIMAVHALVMRMVAMVLRLTPYGVMALMAKVVGGSNGEDILKLLKFVLASYAGLLLILLVHALLLALAGLNPLTFFRKIFPVLTFAFTSRTSAGTIPLNVQAQTGALGVPEAIANFSASFGATIGQNGCAGLYPAMLAVMLAPAAGIDPAGAGFLATLVAVVVVSSFGVAGVGGGATFAALMVLSALHLPVALAGLLISIEPLIDMGRTAVNVSGAMTAGTLTARGLGQIDLAVFRRRAEEGVNGSD